MKLGIIFLAFTFGCVATAFIRVAPDTVNADSKTEKQNLEFSVPDLDATTALEVQAESFGETKDGLPVQKFVCTNENGMVLELADYGATIVAVKIPSPNGLVDVALSCGDIAGYEACESYFGSTLGRFAGHIAGGKFSIDGRQYSLTTNDQEHCFNGGKQGFDRQIWESELIETDTEVGVRFKLTSPDGDEGFPGEIKVIAEYTLDNSNRLTTRIATTADSPTHANVCNHSFWNLKGAGSGSVAEHTLTSPSDHVVELDENGIPTGVLLNTTADQVFDFSAARTIGSGMVAMPAGQLGYDHCFVIQKRTDEELALVAKVVEPESGRSMTVYSSQPAFQFETSNDFEGQPTSGGFEKHAGFLIRPQGYPDAPNQPEFPTTRIEGGKEVSHSTVHQFDF